MSTGRIRLLVEINIHEGKFADFEAIAKQMVAVSEQEPGTLGYHFLLSADRTRCRLIEGYNDAAAITAHFNGPAVQQFVPQLMRVASPVRMEIYGDPGRKSPPWWPLSGRRFSSLRKDSTGKRAEATPVRRPLLMTLDYLLKTEPSEYSFADLLRDQLTTWEGVTNPTAVKHLREMTAGTRGS